MPTDEMTDRERILMNIAAMLASELYHLQFLPAVREYIADPNSLSRVVVDMADKLHKGDLVVCNTSVARQENPWIVSKVELDRCDKYGPCLLRSIGTNDTCNYDNESFLKIVGIPERMLWEGAQRRFQQKVAKAVRKLDTYIHRFRGIEFVSEGSANLWFGECFGGLAKPTKPYAIKIEFTDKTTIKAIIQQLKDGGHGTRAFEPDDGTPSGPFHNPRPITREMLVGHLASAGIQITQ
jgi:hypothetical protein